MYRDLPLDEIHTSGKTCKNTSPNIPPTEKLNRRRKCLLPAKK